MSSTADPNVQPGLEVVPDGHDLAEVYRPPLPGDGISSGEDMSTRPLYTHHDVFSSTTRPELGAQDSPPPMLYYEKQVAPGTDHALPPKPVEPRICGIRKRMCILLLILGAVALLGIAVGTGVGVGLGTRNHQEVSATSATSSASPTAVASPTAIPTVATTCPFGTDDSFRAENGKSFQRFCAIDYGDGEAVNLGWIWAASFDLCIQACSELGACTGAGWGPYPGDSGTSHRCWMKANLTARSHPATADWRFAILRV